MDTSDINEDNKDEMVIFSDNRGVPPSQPGNPNGFISTVNRGKKIRWVGRVKDSGINFKDQEEFYAKNSVDIKEVFVKKEAHKSRILRKNCYRDKKKNGIVIAKVRKTKKSTGVIEGYNITILVNGTDKYTIDPKLQMPK